MRNAAVTKGRHPAPDDRRPVAKIQRLRGFTLFLGDRLEFALEIEPGNFAHDRPQNFVVQRDRGERLFRFPGRAQRLVGVGILGVVEAER